MKVYKFQDTVDGNFDFVIAWDLVQAIHKLYTSTSLPFKFLESRPLSDLAPMIVVGYILPF